MPAPQPSRWPQWLAVLALAVSAITLALAWQTQQHVKSLERELVLRQDASQRDAADARAVARSAQELAQDAAAKSALLEARVAEASMQRSQVEELLSSVARSRDENVVADVEAAIRVALQQSALTGSAEPLLLTLKQADERLARYNQPRLERVRRAIARDVERTRALGAVDVATLAARLDEAVRLVDELPLLAVGRAPAPAAPAAAPASAAGNRRHARSALGANAPPPGGTPARSMWATNCARWCASRRSTTPRACWPRPSSRCSCART